MSIFKRTTKKIKQDAEQGARRNLLEDLFQDFNRNRTQVYKLNFFRGIFFGFGSVIGGTIIVAVLAWVLSFFVDVPGIGDSIQQVQQSIEAGTEAN